MSLQVNVDKIKSNKFISNIFGIGFYRILGVISNFMLVGLIFRYFSDEELNGIWMTIFSIISWLAIFDFGIGNGLRNKLTETITKGNIELSKKYITTTYIVMLIPTIVMILLAFLITPIINWIEVLKIKSPKIENDYISMFILIVIILYALNFYLTLVFAVLHATFNSYKVPMIQMFVNVSNLIIILLLYIFTDVNDLITLGVIYIGSSIIILLFNTIQFFKKKNKELLPGFNYFDKYLINDILGIGVKFLLLQLAIVILFNTDNLLISNFIGVEQVTGYQLVNKILSIFTIILAIVLTPLWTLTIQMKSENNFQKLKSVFKKIFLFIGLLTMGVGVTCLIIPEIIFLWVGNSVSSLTPSLIIFMGIFTFLHMWCNTFQAILNGFNQLTIQVISYGLAMIINIPISIWLVTKTNLGVSAIILGTIISLLIPAVILPIYTFRQLEVKKSIKF